jgi:GNAT superfamily N-acetyltransferase/thiol-disulfide isomerase/thioredoxin
MPSAVIRDMRPEDECYVGTCTHVNESEEIDACAERRLAWLRGRYGEGLRVKVALVDGKQVGFLYVMPIEVSPWGPLGQDLMTIPCLVVQAGTAGKGVGRALIDAAERETRKQGRKGLVTTAYYHDFWFMPARFFERCGFSKVNSRRVTAEGEKEYLSEETVLWKVLDPSAKPPDFMERAYRFEPVPGKVVVDLFWNTFCQTSDLEAHRVGEVVREFGDSVVLREYCADDPRIRSRYQVPRGILVNGTEIGWGYEAPKEGVRKALADALEAL